MENRCLAFLYAAIILCHAVGCSNHFDDAQLVGRWKTEERSAPGEKGRFTYIIRTTTDFRSDGTYNIAMQTDGHTDVDGLVCTMEEIISGSWLVFDGDLLCYDTTKAELVDLKVDPSYESDFDREEMAARTSRRTEDRRCVTIVSVSADHITLRGHAGSDIVMTASD